jgi:hypothetical protein
MKSNASGECQVCGRTQKLVGTAGLVATHGYTERGLGGRSRSCPGSHHLPASTGDVRALDNEIDWHTRNVLRCQEDLAKFQAPDFVWEQGVVPRLAIRSREQGIKNSTQAMAHLMDRRVNVLARKGAK